MNVLESGIGLFGRWSRRINSTSMLLQTGDLPGMGWRVCSDRTWRVGTTPGPPLESEEMYQVRLSNENERAVRARAAGGFIALRSFKLAKTPKSLMSQIFPYSSTDDAEAATSDRFAVIRDRKIDGIVVSEERTIDGEVIGGNRTIYFERFHTHDGDPCVARSIIGSVDRVGFIITGSERPDGWTWIELTAVAHEQAKRIQKKLINRD
jgi:hypothetical protein